MLCALCAGSFLPGSRLRAGGLNYAPWLSVKKKGALKTVRLGKGHRSCGVVCNANAGLASERAEIISAYTSA